MKLNVPIVMNNKLLSLSLVYAAFSFVNSLDASQDKVVDYTGVELSGKLSKNRSFQISVKEEITPGKVSSKVWGWNDGSLNTQITEFYFEIDNDKISISSKAYDDLLNVSLPRGLYLMEKGEDILIYLLGGDGESAYKARLVVRGKHVIRREIIGGNVDDWVNAKILEFKK